MTFTCAFKHQWSAIPESIYNGTWCPRCANCSPEQSKERLLERVKEKKGLVDETKYENGRTQMQFTCAEKYGWLATPEGILSGTWCPTCCESRGEMQVRLALNACEMTIAKPKVLKGTRLRPDFFIESINLIIEFDGEQHFTLRWRGRKDTKIRENDLKKNEWCVENKVHLLRIPWWTTDVQKTVRDTILQLPSATLLVPSTNYYGSS